MKKITPKNYGDRWSRYISIVLVAVFMLSCNLYALAQTQKVSGKVTDAITGESLVGVSVYVKGTQNGTTTDVNGVYAVNNVIKGQILVFSFIGMKTTEIVTDARTTYDVVLQSEATGLDEVVVIGYGTQRKGDVTSSISTVKSDNFLKGSVKDTVIAFNICPGWDHKQSTGNIANTTRTYMPCITRFRT